MKRFFTLLLCLLPTLAWGAIAFDNSSTCYPGAEGDTCTQPFTVSGSDRLLTVGVCVRNGAATATATYNGISMTSYANVTRGGTQRLNIFRLIAPATGTNDVVVTTSASSPFSAGIVSYTGVDPTVPLGTSANATGGSGTPTVDVTSASGELVFDYLCMDDGNTTIPTMTPGTGQTSRVNFTTTTGFPGFDRNVSSSTEAGAATVTMSYPDSDSNGWIIIGAPLLPASAPPPASTRQRSVMLLP